jgi:addiction module HigA family antidote
MILLHVHLIPAVHQDGDHRAAWSLRDPAAKVIGVTRPALSALLNERASLSPEMALRIEKAFGPKMDTLLRMQTSFAIAQARERERDIKVKRYAPKRRSVALRA